MEEKWKLTKKEGSRSRSSNSTSASFKSPPLVRSFSTKCTTSSSSSSSSAATASSSLPRSSSLKYSSSSSPKSPPMQSLSQKGSSFTRKCNSLAKEQKARFYIMRRCVTMLVCWRKYGDRN